MPPEFRLETCMAKITFMQFFVTPRGTKDEDFVQWNHNHQVFHSAGFMYPTL